MATTSPNSSERETITEGYQETFIPEVTYVRQGDKICFFLGESLQHKAICESFDAVQIVESIDEMELIEVTLPNGVKTKLPKDGIWMVEGPYQRSDVKNANKRIYRRSLWEKQIGDPNSLQQQKVKNRGMVGHLEHPVDGRTDGTKGALLTTELKLQEDGVVWGKSELFDTPSGYILQEYTKKKVRWGVSSRGNGTIGDDGYVNEDYVLDTFDAVMSPSTPGAYPQEPKLSGRKKNESVDESTDSDDSREMTEDGDACVQEVAALVETSLDEMDATERRTLAARLLDQHSRVNSLASSQILPHEKAVELQDWLARKLRETHEAGADEADVVDRIIDEAVDGNGDAPNEAYRRVIETLQGRVADAMDESVAVREQVESLSAELESVMADRDEAREGLQAVQLELEATQDQLELASAMIQDHSTTKVEDPVAGAVAEAIEEVPALEEHRVLLEGADSPERVEELAVNLIAAAGTGNDNGNDAHEPTQPIPRSRRALPAGQVVSEAAAGSSRVGKNPSRGAALAGKIIVEQNKNLNSKP